MGAVVGLALAVAAKKLAVKQDRLVTLVYEVLPHLDCGACGYGSCLDYAQNVAKGKGEVQWCAPGGEELARKVAELMGVEVPTVSNRCAVVHCGADCSVRKVRSVYDGVMTCQAANTVVGGYTACGYACLGFGDCMKACPFDAIEMVNGLPHILLDKCTACGNCVRACPRDLITIESYRKESGLVAVVCSSLDSPRDTKASCPVGCIACKICEKKAPGVFKVDNFLAWVNYGEFRDVRSCQEAVDGCPTSCIAVVVPQPEAATVGGEGR